MKTDMIKSYRIKMMLYTMLSIIITFFCDIFIIYIYRSIREFVANAPKEIADSNSSMLSVPYAANNPVPNRNIVIASHHTDLSIPVILFLICFSIILFIVLFHLFTRKTLGYLQNITGALQEISDGHFDTRIDIVGNDEFSLIADKINHMAIDLEFLKKKEDQEDNKRNELITNVAHDLRTPLTSIIGYLDIVKTHPTLPEAQKSKYIDVAYTKSVRLQALIEDLFSFTKLSYNKMPIKKEEFDIVKLIMQEIDEFYPNFMDNNLRCDFTTDCPSYIICADAALIARAFENIIGNAIKYGRHGKIIQISIHALDASHIKISFINYGNVIPKEDLPFLFDQFYRVEHSRSENTGGTGLGLTITKTIIEEHDGTISASSSLSGTIFDVVLNIIDKKG